MVEERSYLIPLNSIDSVIRRRLRPYLSTASDIISLTDIHVDLIETALYGQLKPEYKTFDTCDALRNFGVPGDVALHIAEEARAEMERVIDIMVGGSIDPEHYYDYNLVGTDSIQLIDKGDRRLLAYYKLLRETAEGQLEHGDDFSKLRAGMA